MIPWLAMTTGAPRDLSRCLFCGTRLDARVACGKCGRESPPLDAPRARELHVTCPRCFIGLELSSQTGPQVQGSAAEFLYCIGCHGAFVPPFDWGTLVEHAATTQAKDDLAPVAGEELKVLPPEQGLAHGALQERIGCPVCRVDMERSIFPGAQEVVDVCGLHGIWFDAAELSAVLRDSAKASGEPTEDRRVKQHTAISRFARMIRGD
jgi:Zn-finger nucleic acid-binding protein